MVKKLLVWLGEMYADENELVGEKATKLTLLHSLGFPILPGFVITTQAYREFVDQNKLDTKITHLKGSLTGDKLKKEIKNELQKATLSDKFTSEILKQYVKLSGHLHNTPLMLMTSNHQIISVKGEANLLLEIKNLWNTFLENNSKDDIAIITQLDIPSEKKGVFNHTKQNKETTTLSKEHEAKLQELAEKAHKQFYFPQALHWIVSKNTLYITDVKEGEQDIANQFEMKKFSERIISPLTATKIYVNLSDPQTASKIAVQHVDGVGLLKAELLIKSIGTHPKKIIDQGKSKEYSEKLADGIATVAKAFSPRIVVYRTSDLQTNEYRELINGKEYEANEENPMIGLRGAYRYISDPEVFQLELEAIKLVRNKMGLKNVWLMLPYVRTVKELQIVKTLIAATGLYRSPSFKIWMMIAVPSNVVLLDQFIEQGIDGVSIGSDDLTSLMLGIDRNNHEVTHQFNELDESLLWAYEHVIKIAHKHKITSSFCGEGASVYPQLLKKLIDLGITSISVSPEAIDMTREHIAKIEKEKITNNG